MKKVLDLQATEANEETAVGIGCSCMSWCCSCFSNFCHTIITY